MPSLSPLSSLGKVMLQWLLINPSQIGLSLVAQKVDCVIHRIERAQLVSRILIRWIVIYLVVSAICKESSEQTGAFISSSICTNRLIFGKGAFFSFFFVNMLTNPIIWQSWILLTSRFFLVFAFVHRSFPTIWHRFSQMAFMDRVCTRVRRKIQRGDLIESGDEWHIIFQHSNVIEKTRRLFMIFFFLFFIP